MKPPSNEHPDQLGSRRFLFVTGKGGVGKTTVTAALALALAARGKRVLVALCDAHERLSAILGTTPIDHEIAELIPGVWATRIEPARAMREYGALVLKVRTLARAVFDNRYTKAFLRAVPGLYEWAQLGKAWYHTTEQLADGSRRFDVVLFDAPATGHGLDMLRVPKLIVDIVPKGILRRDAKLAWQMFRNPARSGVVVVSLPEDMPVTETLELVAALRELRLPVARVVVNGMLEPLFSPAERDELLRDPGLLEVGPALEGLSAAERALAAAARRAAREALQAKAVARLQEALGRPLLILPFLLEGAGNREAAQLLATKLS